MAGCDRAVSLWHRGRLGRCRSDRAGLGLYALRRSLRGLCGVGACEARHGRGQFLGGVHGSASCRTWLNPRGESIAMPWQ